MKPIIVIKYKVVKMLEIQHAETGANARKLRLEKGISLRTFAIKMGISAPYLSDLELGKRNWSVRKSREYEKILTETKR